MSKGKCLCGSVRWEFEVKPERAYHCHCSMCRKAHGAAFGTYYWMPDKNFRWACARDTIVEYVSSPELTRAFCGRCGSVVPNGDDEGRYMFVPAGCHDDGFEVDAHIFVGSKAPWHDITDDLPRYDAYPPDDDSPVYQNKSLPDAPADTIRGGCLCDAVEFHVLEPFKVIHNCFCSRCRQARAAAYTTNGFTSMHGVRFIQGEKHVSLYKIPTARYFTHAFCNTCGSGLPRVDAQRNIAVIPLGALDDDPVSRPADNIFVASRALWYDITDDLPSYDEGPPR